MEKEKNNRKNIVYGKSSETFLKWEKNYFFIVYLHFIFE